MEYVELALQGPRNNDLIREAINKFDSDSSDEEHLEINNFQTEKECLLSKLFDSESLCFLIKSRGYGETLGNPLKAAVAIELKVTSSITIQTTNKQINLL